MDVEQQFSEKVEEELEEFREALKESRVDAVLKQDIYSGAVILRRERFVDCKKTTGHQVPHETGRYMVEPDTRYWNPKPIPRGWISFYVEGDPEAISDRDPVGYGALHLERYLGGHLSNLVQGGLKAKSSFELKPWMVVLGSIVVAGVLAYLIWMRRTGGL